MTAKNKKAGPSDKSDIIRDAAVLIIIDTELSDPRVLLGLRNQSLVFMPGKFVFPGGRVDTCDTEVVTADSLSEGDQRLILDETFDYPLIEDPNALALAAIRETFEETGVMIGRTLEKPVESPPPPAWDAFFSHNIVPSPSALKYCARAITPENRVRRYDTRFFCAEAKHIAKVGDFEPGELDEIRWLSIPEAMDTGLATITRFIMSDIQQGLERKTLFGEDFQIPFYHTRDGAHRRDIIT